jgi:MoaA/NifB/PqqE/SkfB family radical SAM enzyme
MPGSFGDNLRKLIENRAFGLLARPGVLANHALFTHELQRRPLRMRATPSSLEIELTNRCNLACIQCLRSQGLKPYELGDITIPNFQRILAQFPRTVSLGLNGFGEPLMHKQFFEILAHARRQLPWAKIVIYTNGQLLDEATCEKLVASGIAEVNVSIDAAMPETYRKVRRGGELEDVHAGMRRLLAARARAGARRPLVGVNFVMLNENEGELVGFIEQAKAIGVDHINCISYASYDWGNQNRRDRGSYEREVAVARRRLDEVGLRCRTLPSIDWTWTEQSRLFDCGFFWGDSVRVAFDGSLTLGCCTPFKETFAYGNVLEVPFGEIWNGPEMVKMREQAKRHVPQAAACVACDKFCKDFFSPKPELAPLSARKKSSVPVVSG